MAPSLIFEVTQQCNHDCVFCYNVWKNPYRSYPRGSLSTADALKLLEKAVKESGCGNVTFSGGEPLLRRDLREMAALAKSLGPTVTVITNGSLLDERRCEELVRAGIDVFEIPLLSDLRDEHDGLCRARGFDRATEALAEVKLDGARSVAVFVATSINAGRASAVASLAFALGCDALMFNRFNAGGEGLRNADRLMPSPDALRAGLSGLDSAAARFRLQVASSVPIQPCIVDTSAFRNLGFGFCAAGTDRSYFTLDSLGNLRMCNHTSRILGSLLEESFERLVSSGAARELCAGRPAFCAGCRLERECRGGCPAASEESSGVLTSEEPFLAKFKSGQAL